MNQLAHSFFNIDVALRYLPDLLKGLLVTIELSIMVVLTGVVLGVLLAMLRSAGWRGVNALIILFADILRSLPPLMIIVVGFFGMPYLGLRLSGMFVSWFALSLVLAAFTEELVWAGLSSLPKGQDEAARSTGMSHSQVLIHVLVPQALRRVMAPLTSRIIATVKNTSLASVVAVPDLLAEASAALGYASNATPLIVAAIGYLLFLVPLVTFSRRLERRFRWA
ncbi:amino acid ABC transporter permease [Xanthobacter dioxanivorans]|uniref:Amino acid ABC transporter permease n=1 Tax=Xanthobacter dioxanivorans TaxID=2528964 RepID=A0A974SGF2_9HYPH|nr:amino acid ABC transporter permease [Xanthobacter dioxanivorans]QRG04660.1 amino acid ABC transporter permease [Xanthobacter dioxanivorans]